MKFRPTFFLFFFLFAIAKVPYSFPRFALKGGEASCRGCHIDPTGGRMRTEGGDNFAMNRLAMWPTDSKFSANIGEGIRIGADWRSQFLYFSDHISFPANYAALGHTRPDTTMRASGGLEMALPVYLSVQLTEAVQAYGKFDPIVSQITSNSWEAYAIVHFIHSSGEFFKSSSTVSDAYFKVGAFYPAFGIRFDDHSIYTRGGNADLSGFGAAGLFWQPDYKDEGVELGAELFDHAFITADVLNGNEGSGFGAPGQLQIFKDNPLGPYAVSLRGVMNTGPLMDGTVSAEIGGSLYFHTVENIQRSSNPTLFDSIAHTTLAGIHGGFHLGPVSVLAEADFGQYIYHIASDSYSDTVHALAIEGAVDIFKGLTGILRFETYRDGSRDSMATNIARFTFGLQWFPVRFLEIRPEFRIARGTTTIPGEATETEDHTETTALIQTHIFF